MKEDYISFEIANLVNNKLPKLKFVVKDLSHYYNEFGELDGDQTPDIKRMVEGKEPLAVRAFTQSILAKYLREVFNIDIIIAKSLDKGYYYDITKNSESKFVQDTQDCKRTYQEAFNQAFYFILNNLL
jgi:hypothetical protein